MSISGYIGIFDLISCVPAKGLSVQMIRMSVQLQVSLSNIQHIIDFSVGN